MSHPDGSRSSSSSSPPSPPTPPSINPSSSSSTTTARTAASPLDSFPSETSLDASSLDQFVFDHDPDGTAYRLLTHFSIHKLAPPHDPVGLESLTAGEQFYAKGWLIREADETKSRLDDIRVKKKILLTCLRWAYEFLDAIRGVWLETDLGWYKLCHASDRFASMYFRFGKQAEMWVQLWNYILEAVQDQDQIAEGGFEGNLKLRLESVKQHADRLGFWESILEEKEFVLRSVDKEFAKSDEPVWLERWQRCGFRKWLTDRLELSQPRRRPSKKKRRTRSASGIGSGSGSRRRKRKRKADPSSDDVQRKRKKRKKDSDENERRRLAHREKEAVRARAQAKIRQQQQRERIRRKKRMRAVVVDEVPVLPEEEEVRIPPPGAPVAKPTSWIPRKPLKAKKEKRVLRLVDDDTDPLPIETSQFMTPPRPPTPPPPPERSISKLPKPPIPPPPPERPIAKPLRPFRIPKRRTLDQPSLDPRRPPRPPSVARSRSRTASPTASCSPPNPPRTPVRKIVRSTAPPHPSVVAAAAAAAATSISSPRSSVRNGPPVVAPHSIGTDLFHISDFFDSDARRRVPQSIKASLMNQARRRSDVEIPSCVVCCTRREFVEMVECPSCNRCTCFRCLAPTFCVGGARESWNWDGFVSGQAGRGFQCYFCERDGPPIQ